MKQRITIIPVDKLILVNGEGLRFDFTAPDTIHAIQWRNGAGHIEYTDGQWNTPLDENDYPAQVKPFADLWDAEKARLEEEANKPAALPEVHAATVRAINAALESAIAPIMADAPPSAVATYSEQRAEAEAYSKDATAPTPMLDTLTAARGIEKADLVQRVLEKSALHKQASSLLLGQQQSLMDAVKAIMADARLSDAEKATALEQLNTTIALPAQFTEICLAAIRESMSGAAAGSAQKPTLFAKLKQVFSNKE